MGAADTVLTTAVTLSLLNPGRNHLSRVAEDHAVGGGGDGGGLEVDFDSGSTALPGQFHQPGGGMNIARGADQGEEIRLFGRLDDLIEEPNVLTEPDEVRAAQVRIAARAAVLGEHQVRRRPDMAAAGTKGILELPMHGEDVLRPRALMEIVHVLGDEKETAMMPTFQLGERKMGGVRDGRAHALAPEVVELMVSVRCPRSDGVMEYLLDVHH